MNKKAMSGKMVSINNSIRILKLHAGLMAEVMKDIPVLIGMFSDTHDNCERIFSNELVRKITNSGGNYTYFVKTPDTEIRIERPMSLFDLFIKAKGELYMLPPNKQV